MLRPARGRCLVKRVETAESFAGGKIVLPESFRERLANQQVEILAVGEPSICEDEDCQRPHDLSWTHPVSVKAGNWVLIAPRSLVEGPDETYLVRQDDILAVLSPD